ncbi:MBL fold metallo-hydrolase [uncultured Prevotella sp.]|uniref:MBL fold metallo-hydrolase n=1 Tax=uncultured Prevotella sp. TaxID=159272 RepID=UPI0025FA4974|nr:MBL fold metallo-hydrolase [uncultured Prevotella sp.]
MMVIKTFEVNPLQENCYVVSDDTKDCVIIDCGAYYDAERQAITNYIRGNKLTPKHLLCTHGHFDHNFGNDTIFDEFGLKPEIHADDEALIADVAHQCEMMGMGLAYYRQSPPIGHRLEDGETITFGTHSLKVIHTPGHSKGGVVFYCEAEKTLFTGDTLFRMSVGRTDLPGGSWGELMDSLEEKIATLPKDTVAYPGHGPKTLLSDEFSMNPYFR